MLQQKDKEVQIQERKALGGVDEAHVCPGRQGCM